jgi:hypothetical protein
MGSSGLAPCGQAPAVQKRPGPRHFCFLFNGWFGQSQPLQHRRETEPARPGRVGRGEDREYRCLYSERTGFSPATGDFRSPVVLPQNFAIASQAQQPLSPRLCAFARVVGWAALRFLFGWYLRLSALSAVSPVERIRAHLCDLWAKTGGWMGLASLVSWW